MWSMTMRMFRHGSSTACVSPLVSRTAQQDGQRTNGRSSRSVTTSSVRGSRMPTRGFATSIRVASGDHSDFLPSCGDSPVVSSRAFAMKTWVWPAYARTTTGSSTSGARRILIASFRVRSRGLPTPRSQQPRCAGTRSVAATRSRSPRTPKVWGFPVCTAITGTRFSARASRPEQ